MLKLANKRNIIMEDSGVAGMDISGVAMVRAVLGFSFFPPSFSFLFFLPSLGHLHWALSEH